MKNVFSKYAFTGALLLLQFLNGSAQAVKLVVSGYVFQDVNQNGLRDNNEPGLSKAVVSNQVNITTTNDQGFYELVAVKGYDIVFVSTPDNYAIDKNFWQHTSADTGQVNFAMRKIKAVASFTFIQASDTHISEKTVDRMDKFRSIVDSVKPDLLIITGDLVKDALRVGEKEASTLYQLFARESSKISVPLRLVPGNHEIFGIERHLSLVNKDNPMYGRNMYRHYFGPDYYSFNYGGVHFIGLNSLSFEDLWYYGNIDSVQLAWMKKDLALIAASTPVVTFQHVPFFSGGVGLLPYEDDGPGRVLEKENGILQFRHIVSNAHAVLTLLQNKNFPLALAGHFHSRQQFLVEGLPTRFEQTGAVISSSVAGSIQIPSGVTVYNVKSGQISEGHFIPLDKK